MSRFFATQFFYPQKFDLRDPNSKKQTSAMISGVCPNKLCSKTVTHACPNELMVIKGSQWMGNVNLESTADGRLLCQFCDQFVEHCCM